MFNGFRPKFNNSNVNNSMLTLPMQTGIYEIIENRNKFTLKLISDKFTEPDKIYGKLKFYVKFYFKAILRKNFKVGFMFTGIKGAGKTELAKILCNKCIDHGLRVVNVNNVRYSKELVIFLETLDNTVFFFDEFSKIFKWDGQERLLTFLSNTLGRERVVIITDNNINNISDFIKNRPGRVRYGKHFEKLEIETVIEYMEDFDLDNEFKENLLKLYKKTPDFTVDHLKAIVSEYLEVKDIEFDELISLLNLSSMVPEKVLQLVSVNYVGDLVKYKDASIDITKYVLVTPTKLNAKSLTIDFTININISYEDEKLKNKTLFLSKKDIFEMVSDKISFIKDDYEINFIIVNENEWKSNRLDNDINDNNGFRNNNRPFRFN